ncbi:protein TIFY 10b-like [Phragmites australis]|uniref:protein TIFY 10b-like n=1 Tax=Phragmites australis TaxID=29695 RepID=UPI002D79C0D8|nr:protein TIFY 10b-like [Phragmites australis]
MAASTRPKERVTSFVVPCSLVNYFVRQNSTPVVKLGFVIKGETKTQRAPTTMHLLPGVEGEEAERRKETMELIPQSAGFSVQDASTASNASRYYY